MSLLLMKSLFFLVLLAIKEQFHIKSLQGSSLHLEASQIANSSDLKKEKSIHQSLFLDIGYCLLSQVIIWWGWGGALTHTGKLQHIMYYTIKREKN